MKKRTLPLMIICLITAVNLQANESADTLIKGMEQLMWGTTTHGQFTMTIKTPYWERQLALEAWLDRPAKTFIRIHAPKKEQDIGSLRIGGEMWNYLPKVDRTVKIPPSMMLQPWMGSDFSNDDLVKESSLEADYTHQITQVEEKGDNTIYHITSIPKPNAPVVWGKLVFQIDSHYLPIQETFYDDQGQVVKTMYYSDIRTLDGHRIPTRWRMIPSDKPAQFTEIVINELAFDHPLDADIFTLRNLRNPK